MSRTEPGAAGPVTAPPRPHSRPVAASEAVSEAEARRTRRALNRIVVCAGGGEVCDGWVLGVVGAAMPLARTDLSLGTLSAGLIGAASLIGIFLGGLCFGPLADRIGRRRMYLVDLGIFLVGSLLQLVVDSGAELFAVRLLMGIAVGADYAIAGALVAEFAPTHRRGRLLASLIAYWYAGYVLATVLGAALTAWSDDPGLWRWILASSALPSLAVLIARTGTPESPRWLAGRGRRAEADAVCRRWLGTRLDDLDETMGAPAGGARTGFATLFSPAYRRRTLFTSVFWLCQVTPFFAISTFAPQVFASLGAADDGVGETALNCFLLVGCLCGTYLMDRTGRRPLLIVPFLVTALALLVLGLWPHGPQWMVVGCFALFGLFHAGSSTLQAVYPSEVFPTAVRATGIGLAAATSRIGAAAGTFLVPMGLQAWGAGAVMLCGAALSLAGAAVSAAWAPETSGLELAAASTPDEGRAHAAM
ncbi:MFS transporter [Streptomyces sp. NPDC059590]|uniref:MFS transporter n=1 Tax=Streptomyces sp. NPDC059590 TaxID=3346877 RepID=UPI00368E8B57